VFVIVINLVVICAIKNTIDFTTVGAIDLSTPYFYFVVFVFNNITKI
jgi:hypothetical protein